MPSTPEILQGRCLAIEPPYVIVQNSSGVFRGEAKAGAIAPGDLIEVKNGHARVLTQNRASGRTQAWTRRILDPRRRKAIERRGQVEAAIRKFFVARGFLETRTPLLVPSPGMEPHIRPFRAVPAAGTALDRPAAFLPTSPEFAMKRLLAGGLERIFQICPAFRDEPRSSTHLPEFTMLEWYRAYAGYEQIMRDTEELLAAIAQELFGKPSLIYQGREISVAPPWPRLRVRDLFQEHAGVDLVACPRAEDLARECRRLGLPVCDGPEPWDDLYFKIWLNVVEPRLPADRAVFVTRYPASQAALSVLDRDPDGSIWAKRFEAYAGGIELANAFEELTDPEEQRRRFEEDMELRARLYGPEFPKSPIDEGFLGALAEGMPPSGGIALGVDRLVMLFADEPEIGYTFWLAGN